MIAWREYGEKDILTLMKFFIFIFVSFLFLLLVVYGKFPLWKFSKTVLYMAMVNMVLIKIFRENEKICFFLEILFFCCLMPIQMMVIFSAMISYDW